MKKVFRKPVDKRMVVPFCACVLMLAVLACALVWSYAAGAKRIAERYAENILYGEADAIYAMYTPEAVSYLLRETELTETDMKSNLRHKMSVWQRKNVTDVTGDLIDVEVSLVSKKDVPRETVKELETNFGVNAQSAKCMTVSYHAEGEKGSKDGEMTVYAVKIGGNWYLYDLQMLLE